MSNRVVALENLVDVPVGTLGNLVNSDTPYHEIAWDGMPHNPYPMGANEYKYVDEDEDGEA